MGACTRQGSPKHCKSAERRRPAAGGWACCGLSGASPTRSNQSAAGCRSLGAPSECGRLWQPHLRRPWRLLQLLRLHALFGGHGDRLRKTGKSIQQPRVPAGRLACPCWVVTGPSTEGCFGLHAAPLGLTPPTGPTGSPVRVLALVPERRLFKARPCAPWALAWPIHRPRTACWALPRCGLGPGPPGAQLHGARQVHNAPPACPDPPCRTWTARCAGGSAGEGRGEPRRGGRRGACARRWGAGKCRAADWKCQVTGRQQHSRRSWPS